MQDNNLPHSSNETLIEQFCKKEVFLDPNVLGLGIYNMLRDQINSYNDSLLKILESNNVTMQNIYGPSNNLAENDTKKLAKENYESLCLEICLFFAYNILNKAINDGVLQFDLNELRNEFTSAVDILLNKKTETIEQMIEKYKIMNADKEEQL